MFDYAGIGLYGLGSVIIHLAYCSEPEFYDIVRVWFVPAGMLLAFTMCFCNSIAKVIYKRPYPFQRKLWQIIPVGSIYILLVSPVVHRLAMCLFTGSDCNESIPYHVKQIFFFLLSAAFFSADWPQRMFPGACDLFFHSHQVKRMLILLVLTGLL